MSTIYRASFKSLQNQGLSLHYRQNTCETIIKCTKPAPSNFPESQTGLYLDISLRENSKNQQNWASFQNNMKEVFDQIIQLENYPNSMVKISIFLIEQGHDIQACIINALWLLLLKLGINMKKSIFCIAKSENKKLLLNDIAIVSQSQSEKALSHRVIYNLNDVQSIIEGETSASQIIHQDKNLQQVNEKAQEFRNFVLQALKSNIFN